MPENLACCDKYISIKISIYLQEGGGLKVKVEMILAVKCPQSKQTGFTSINTCINCPRFESLRKEGSDLYVYCRTIETEKKVEARRAVKAIPSDWIEIGKNAYLTPDKRIVCYREGLGFWTNVSRERFEIVQRIIERVPKRSVIDVTMRELKISRSRARNIVSYVRRALKVLEGKSKEEKLKVEIEAPEELERIIEKKEEEEI